MTEKLITKTKTQYLADLAKVSPNGDPGWLKHLRVQAADRFEQAELPNTRMEEWRQTNIAAINSTPFRSLVAPIDHGVTPGQIEPHLFGGDAWAELVFVDGFFAPALSAGAPPEGVRADSLHAAPKGPLADVVEAHLGRYLQDRNAYTALNSAFLSDGAVVHVAKNAVVETPVHLVFVTSAREADTAAHLRNLIVLEEGAQASIVVSFVSLAGGARYLNNSAAEISLGANSELHFYKVVQESAAGNHLDTIEVRHERDSRFRSFVLTLGGAIVRTQVCALLAGSGADTSLHGLYLNDGERLIDNALLITHEAPHCTSRIAYKGILDDRSHAVFTGKVFVHREAQKTDSNQLSNNLLLSDGAAIDAKPQLEIFADDVKCTHGATVGAPPEGVIFYFRSRGIDEATARAMLTYGFADEIVSEILVEALQDRLRSHIFNKYSPEEVR